MTKIAIAPVSAGTGTVTLSAPETNDSVSLELPGTTGVLATLGALPPDSFLGSGAQISTSFVTFVGLDPERGLFIPWHWINTTSAGRNFLFSLTANGGSSWSGEQVLASGSDNILFAGHLTVNMATGVWRTTGGSFHGAVETGGTVSGSDFDGIRFRSSDSATSGAVMLFDRGPVV